MVRAFRVSNPYNPNDGLERTEFKPGVSLGVVGADYVEKPWLCVAYIDGKRSFPLRSEWKDIELQSEDFVYFMPHVADGGISLIITAIISVASIVIALTVAPPTISDLQEADPVFDLKGQKNQVKLGKPIEDGYGLVRIWPSYAARPYNQYYGNNQFQFQLFSLGHGTWDVDEVRIEDTLISSFQEVEFEIYEPGEVVNLFPNNVETSIEVGTIELFGPNEGEYTGAVGPFIANQTGTTTTHLEVDLVMPQGLYIVGSDGDIKLLQVQVLVEYRLIDDAGLPLDTWQTLVSFDQTLATQTPQRFTYSIDVNDGRYEVRAVRTNDARLSTQGSDRIQWTGLRAFLPSTETFGDITMLAVKARATNNLNDAASNRINVIATRKLPDYDSGTNTLAAVDDAANRTATRSPVWAMVNIIRSAYGGNLADEYLDLAFFAAEATAAETAGINFDWIFDQRGTVWEALKAPCFINKSIPILNGSRVSFIRDEPSTLPTFFINPENTIAGSFKLERKLFDLQENGGMEVEYVDPDSWKQEVVACLLPGNSGLNLKRIKLDGVTDRQKAFDLGMYLWYKESNEREQISIATGMEGHLPTYGDVGRFGSDVPRWGQNGFVTNIVGSVVSLSEVPIFTDGETHQLALRGKHGQDLGPYTVTAGTGEKEVIVTGTLPSNEFFFDYQNEPPYFIFGVSDVVGKVCRVVSLTPQGQDAVTINAIVDDQGRHADFGTAPVKENLPTPPTIPDLPVVDGLEILPNAAQGTYVATWNPAFGALNYILEQSVNGTDWVEIIDTNLTNFTFVSADGEFHMRVAAVNVGIGPFDTIQIVLGVSELLDEDFNTLVDDEDNILTDADGVI